MKTTLSLNGFQSHLSSIVNVTKNYVCFVGPNNVGKSSVARFVRWVVYDALRGTGWIHKSVKTANGSIEFEDVKVGRTKGKGKNDYSLNGEEFNNVKKGVPPEVGAALNMDPVYVDKDLSIEVHVVQQKDHPFLMDETGSTKAKVLNALTGRHVLDVATRETGLQYKRLQTEERTLTARIAQLEQDLVPYSRLDANILSAQAAKASLEDLQGLVARAKAMRTGMMLVEQAQLAVVQARVAKQLDIVLAEQLLAQLQTHEERADGLRSQANVLAAAEAAVAQAAASPALDTAKAEVLLSLLDELTVRKGLLIIAGAHVDAVSAAQVKALIAQDDQSAAEEAWKAIIGSTCPTCGNAITEKCLQEVMS